MWVQDLMHLMDRMILVCLIPAWVLLAMVIWLAGVLPFIQDLKDKKVIRTVQKLELGDGVTLLQGIRAYFGEKGTWGRWGNWVQVFMGDPEIVFHIEIVPTDEETEKLELHVLDHGRIWVSTEEAEEVFDMLIEAAKEQRAHPKT